MGMVMEKVTAAQRNAVIEEAIFKVSTMLSTTRKGVKAGTGREQTLIDVEIELMKMKTPTK